MSEGAVWRRRWRGEADVSVRWPQYPLSGAGEAGVGRVRDGRVMKKALRVEADVSYGGRSIPHLVRVKRV